MADAGVGDEPGELALGQDIAGQPAVREEEGSEIEGWMSQTKLRMEVSVREGEVQRMIVSMRLRVTSGYGHRLCLSRPRKL